MSSNASRLEMATNVVLIVVLLLFAGEMVQRFLSPAAPSAAASPSDYAKGEQFPALEGLTYADSKKTLVVFVASTCRFCDESMPYYTKLQLLQKPGGFRLVMVGLEDRQKLASYLSSHGVSPSQIVTIKPNAVRIAATPTMVLVDDQGKVVGFWRGALRTREREVDALLASAAS